MEFINLIGNFIAIKSYLFDDLQKRKLGPINHFMIEDIHISFVSEWDVIVETCDFHAF